MKNWSLGYELIRYYVRLALWLSYKRKIVTGRQLIPNDKPIIFAANHQNALMDSLAVVCTNPSQSVWLARADIFKSKRIAAILRYMKLTPVYRIRDGKENLSNNEQVFAQVAHLLEMKESIALFPEAAHSGRRQMLPHKKAIPRIALETENKNNFKLGLQIVPVGIYYSHYWDFNRTVIVQYSNPIEVDKYRDEYRDNPQKAMLSLRDEIYERLVPLTMQINSIPFYQDYENIREVAGKAWSKTQHFSKKKPLQLFFAENDLIKKLEHLEAKQPEKFERLIEKIRVYFSALSSKNLTDKLVNDSAKSSWIKLLSGMFAMLITLPVFAVGFIFNALPFFIPRHIIRGKVKDKAFQSTFFFATGLLIFPILYLLEAAILLAFTKSLLITVSAFILMPFAGKIAYKLLVFYRHIFQMLTYLAGNNSFRKNLKDLAVQRKQLIEFVFEQIKL